MSSPSRVLSALFLVERFVERCRPTGCREDVRDDLGLYEINRNRVLVRYAGRGYDSVDVVFAALDSVPTPIADAWFDADLYYTSHWQHNDSDDELDPDFGRVSPLTGLCGHLDTLRESRDRTSRLCALEALVTASRWDFPDDFDLEEDEVPIIPRFYHMYTESYFHRDPDLACQLRQLARS